MTANMLCIILSEIKVVKKWKFFPSLKDSQFSGAVCGNLSIYSRIEFPLYPIQLLLLKLRKVYLLKKITGSARPLSACGTFFWDQPDQENNNIVDLHPSKTKPQKNITWTPPHLREADPFQNGWIFGKVPNGLWPPPLTFGKLCCKFFS